MCKICHKKVDNRNTTKYPVEKLKEWKNKREHDAELEVGRPKNDVQTISLAENDKTIIKKIDNVQKEINHISSSFEYKFDNYGIPKKAINQFKELDNCLINRYYMAITNLTVNLKLIPI